MTTDQNEDPSEDKQPAQTTGQKRRRGKRRRRKNGEGTRQRQVRPYPASTFRDALPLGQAIMKVASGEKVRRLTLLQQMDKSPNSSGTKMLITNSGKYGITSGSYAAEFPGAHSARQDCG